jgi:hypothetical protein
MKDCKITTGWTRKFLSRNRQGSMYADLTFCIVTDGPFPIAFSDKEDPSQTSRLQGIYNLKINP